MTTARLISKRPVARDLPDGSWQLEETMVIDLGVCLGDLHAWVQRVNREDARHAFSLSNENTTIITIPAGFTTDFSSIPLLAQLLVFGPRSKYRIAGACHDLPYRLGAPRGASDRIWYIVARSTQHDASLDAPADASAWDRLRLWRERRRRFVNPVQGWLGWLGLRAFGGFAYRRRNRERRES